MFRASHSRIPEIVGLAKKIRRRRPDILRTIRLGYSNARLEARVRVSQPDRAQDVGAAPSDLLGESDDLGYARMGRPEHPAVQFRRGLADRVLEQGAQEFLELPCAVELALGVRVPQAFVFVFN